MFCLRIKQYNHHMNQIEHLIIKFLTRSISKKELDELIQFLENSENDDVFDAYVKINYSINYNMTNHSPDKIKEELLNRIKADKRTKKNIQYKQIFKYAAILICVLSISYYAFYNISKTADPVLDIVKELESDEIILKLENGQEKVVKTNESKSFKNKKGSVYGKQKSDTLEYVVIKGVKDLVYNELIVPYGKRFTIVLSDGTTIDLNSGTYIKYPIQFIDGLNREVILKGEAYFNVAHKDKDRFIVNIDDLNIEVLGTKFNVSCYTEDKKIETALVEGAVKIEKEKSKISKRFLLKPGQLASYNKLFNEMAIINTDVTFYTDWRFGAVRFKSVSFNDILKELERHFDVTIKNDYKYLGEQIYTASFYDGESIENILSYFNEDTQFIYSKNKDNIIITNPLIN